MREESTYVSAHDGHALFVRTWLPDAVDGGCGAQDQPRAVIHLLHGMTEHCGRYVRFAQALTDRGYAVVADDHRGHGRTVNADLPLGHTGDGDGWEAVLTDISTVRALVTARWPGVPVILMGHSWGSLLARGWVARHGRRVAPGSADRGTALAGLILMGTAGDPGVLGRVGVGAARALAALRGPRYRSAVLESAAFTRYNRPFEPARTEVDWLSRDAAEVDAYRRDPLCGTRCTAGFYRDLARGAVEVSRPRAWTRVPADLPVLVVSGQADPVGDMGRGVRMVAQALAGAGVRDVTLTLYPQARHELLNELNRREVTADLLAWTDERTGRAAAPADGA